MTDQINKIALTAAKLTAVKIIGIINIDWYGETFK